MARQHHPTAIFTLNSNPPSSASLRGHDGLPSGSVSKSVLVLADPEFGGGPDLLTVDQVAEILEVAPDEVVELQRLGHFRDLGQGESLYLLPDVERFLIRESGISHAACKGRIVDVLWPNTDWEDAIDGEQ